MRTYLKNLEIENPNPIWNDEALGFFEEVAPTTTRKLCYRKDDRAMRPM